MFFAAHERARSLTLTFEPFFGILFQLFERDSARRVRFPRLFQEPGEFLVPLNETRKPVEGKENRSSIMDRLSHSFQESEGNQVRRKARRQNRQDDLGALSSDTPSPLFRLPEGHAVPNHLNVTTRIAALS